MCLPGFRLPHSDARYFRRMWRFCLSQESYSHQAGGNNSVTESLQKEKVLKARDIAGQAAGHFIGKIAGGKPPFFSVQMDMCRFEEKEIPRFSLPVKLGNGKEEMELEILEEIIPVSYTHLDVYKRQG